MKTIGVGVVALLCVSLVACGGDGGNNDGGTGGGAAGTGGGAAGTGGGMAGSGGTAGASGGTAGASGGTAGTGVMPGLRITVSCHQSAAGTCFEYVNYPGEGAEQLRMSCTMTAGTPGSSCPRASAVGVCTTPTTNEVSLRTVYYPPTYDSSQASALQQVCMLAGGTWSAS